MKSSNKGKDFCVFALPGLFCFLAVVMVPFIYGIYLTLTDWNGVSSVKNFVGLSNFAAVMRDAQFWKSCLHHGKSGLHKIHQKGSDHGGDRIYKSKKLRKHSDEEHDGFRARLYFLLYHRICADVRRKQCFYRNRRFF